MNDLREKTQIVDWKKEPYEYYEGKDLNPRHEMYIVKNKFESKFANKIDDALNYQRFILPERDEHKPQYDTQIRNIDLASINVEKIHQVNEQRLSKLDRDYKSTGNLMDYKGHNK
mmetsp:Transcript_14656/g.14285  ORF Transcript_14656/g.14285 Transcript_14656/m.14285 type:complete len:115 (+) Transcript_14656:952-1296(+)